MSRFYIAVDGDKATFKFYQYNKPRRTSNYENERLISIKTSGNLDCKPWTMLYFNLEGNSNRITDTNVPELKQYIKEV